MLRTMSLSPAPPQTPARTLGTLDTACIVIGAVIGLGIFFSPGRFAAIAKTPVLALAGWMLAATFLYAAVFRPRAA